MCPANLLTILFSQVQFVVRLVIQSRALTAQVDVVGLFSIGTRHYIQVVVLGEGLGVVHVSIQRPGVALRHVAEGSRSRLADDIRRSG